MRIAICDDERKEIMKMEDILIQMDGNYQIECFDKIDDFWPAAARRPRFDLAFLDIYMGDENGIAVAQRLLETSPDTAVVFTTVSQEHAVDAFSVRALHYLIKPVKEEDVFEIFKRMGRKKEMRRTLTVRIERSINVLYQDEILKVESQGHRTIITMVDRNLFSIRKGFGEILSMLDDSFLYVKKGVAVNMYYIECFRADDCVLADGTRYLLQRSRKKEIKEKYFEFAMNKMEK